MNIVLASASPRRRELMNFITEDFIAVSTDADETLPNGIETKKASEYLSLVKAKSASADYPEDIVIGCDTIVVVDDVILGKPKDFDQCCDYIRLLSGRAHSVITGCTLIYKESVVTFSVETEVHFRQLTESEIAQYASTDEPYDKAGGYAVQGKGALLIDKINGDYFNVVGLPVSRLNQELISFKNNFI